jgi:acetoacetate decarboxylase
MAGDGSLTRATLSETRINLKLIPGVDGHAEVCRPHLAFRPRGA